MTGRWANGMTGRKGRNMQVVNLYGAKIEYNVAVAMMDDELREAIARDWDEGCGEEQEFFDAYCEAHKSKFGEAWELDKPNPIY